MTILYFISIKMYLEMLKWENVVSLETGMQIVQGKNIGKESIIAQE